MTSRSHLLAAASAATAAAVLAVPALASAASVPTVVAGPFKAKGYTITLTATDGGAADTFDVNATKTSGGSTQMHSWSFGSGVKVSVKGGKATIKGSLGKYGKVDATLKAGGPKKGALPKGCKGTAGTTRSGLVTGKTTLSLDTTFFKTQKPKGLKGSILTGGDITCGPSKPEATKGLMLSVPGDGAADSTMLTVSKAGGQVSQMAMSSEDQSATAPASVFHMIMATTGASGLDAAADLTTAKAPAAGPFFSGTLSFAGEAAGASDSPMAAGTASGDFTAKFDVIEPFTVPAGATAMLMQQ